MTNQFKKKAEKLRDAEIEITQLKAQLDGIGKCSDGRVHILYAIESGGWIEEVGCERCLFKVIGRKASSPEQQHSQSEAKCGIDA